MDPLAIIQNVIMVPCKLGDASNVLLEHQRDTKSVAKLAEHYNVSSQIIYNEFSKREIFIKRGKLNPKIIAWIWENKKEKTITKMAKYWDVNYEVIRDVLSEKTWLKYHPKRIKK